MTPHSCPSAERWKAHLDGSLSQTEQTVLTSHLDGCPSCQKTLETLAAGGDSLLEIARRVGEPLAHTEGKITPEAGSATTAETMHESSQRMDEGLDFLAPSTKPDSIGRLGHYEIQEVIGQGGFGVVLKAFDEKLHRVVAIKVLSPSVASSGTARQRFTREARAAAAVTHEHVVTIHAVEDDANPPYLVMQLVAGMSLQDKLDKQGPLGLKEILRIGLQTACGLAAAHKQGLVHRDIKPANILLENGVERVKITDFGLARAVDDASLTQSGVVAGTPMFMAPEQAEGLNVDARADLFSLGSVLYLMCTGRPPFRATTTLAVLKRVVEDVPRPIREINPEIPEWLCDIVTKLHAKKPEDRYPSATEVADVLEERLAELQFTGRAEGRKAPVEAPSAESINRPLTRHGSPRRALLAVATVSMLALAAILAVVYWPRSADVPEKKDPIVENKPPIVPVVKLDDEWVQLFNGKDLTGWFVGQEKSFSGPWNIEDGVLVGRDRAILWSRKHHTEFHCRIRAKFNSECEGAFSFRIASGELARIRIGNKKADWLTGALSVYADDMDKPLSPMSHDLVPPDTWFDLDVIVRGKHVIAKVNGKTTVDQTVERLQPRGQIRLDTHVRGSVLHVEKIEIKELPTTPPAETQPFVVLAKANRTETGHPTLADAVGAAQSGDTIEIQGNGPFATEPINLVKKVLTIRAGAGFRPHLRHLPTDPKSTDALIRFDGPLALEGLILERAANPGATGVARGTFVLVGSGASLYAAHCRLLGDKLEAAVSIRLSPGSNLVNSEILGDFHTGFRYKPMGGMPSRLVLDNNVVLVRSHGLWLLETHKDIESVVVTLRHNTIQCGQPYTVGVAQPVKYWVNGERKKPSITMEATRNVLDATGTLFDLVLGPENADLLADAAVQLPRVLAYRDEENLYARRLHKALLVVARDGELKRFRSLESLEEWHKFWGIARSTSLLDTPVYQGGDVNAKALNSPTQVTPADLRLAKGSPGQGVRPGGKDLGADVDLVGPGEAYEKWQKTPAYQEWRKKTEELLQNP